MNREELIVEALASDVHEEDGWLSDAQTARLEWDADNRVVRFHGEGSIDLAHLAEIASTATEQAHTPTEAYEKPLDTSPEPAKNGADSLHVTPTDDEREALSEFLFTVYEHGSQPNALREADAILVFLATRRTAVNATEREAHEVCAWCPGDARGSAWHNDGKLHPSCGQIDHGGGWVPDERARRPVQGEPTDAQLAEIEQRVYDEHRPHIAGMAKALVRAGWDAALRAAAATQEGENRG